MPTDPNRARALFLSARELPPGRCTPFLNEACGADGDLRAEVERLLAAASSEPSEPGPLSQQDTRADLLSERPTQSLPPGSAGGAFGSAGSVGPGTVLAGRYTLTVPIGEGGMGSVWAAQQSEPVKRSVAVKLVKAGMDSKSVLARFEQERQALALMEHPNIAKVFDAGLTPTGQPFFVMELVDGQPLTAFCDEARLTPRQRLELFVPICQAVQHAHQKGIVHRDLKPANILVTLVDGRPMPKVIDFGVAKAAEGSLLDMSMATQLGAVIGTLEYMAPEQAGFLGADIDTRADIYSLGVILYELLTGRRPIEAQRLRKAALAEMIRMIQEDEPPRPSRRLSGEATLNELAAVRRTEPGRLLTLLRGDLDWVVMKCLEKQRERRYETANGLARDIQRFLADEVVEARPPSTGYRLGKFLRRNRGSAVAVAAVALSLVVGLVAFAWQARVARQQRDLAQVAGQREATQRRLATQERDRALAAEQGEIAQRHLADAQRDLARAAERAQAASRLRSEEARRRAELIAEFMGDTLKGAGPSLAVGRDATMLREMMDGAAARIVKGDLKTAPEAELRLRLTIGDAYRDLAAFDPALNMLEPALALARTTQPGDSANTADALNALAYLRLERGELPGAEALFRESLAMRRRLVKGDHPELANSMDLLGRTLQVRGDVQGAEPLFRAALAMRKRLYPGDHPELALSLNSLGVLLQLRGDLAGAEPLLRETLAMDKRLYPGDHPYVAIALGTLAQVLATRGDLAGAELLTREGLAMQKRLHKGDHQDVASASSELGSVLQAKGDLASAEPLFREALAMYRRLFPGDHEFITGALFNLGSVLRTRGDLAGAESLYRESLAMRKRLFPGDHILVAGSLNDLGILLQNRGDAAGAEAHYREALAMQRRLFPGGQQEVANTMLNLARFLRSQGNLAGAEPLYREGAAMSERVLGRDHWKTVLGWIGVGQILMAQKRFPEAEPHLLRGQSGLAIAEGVPSGYRELSVEFLVSLYEAWDKTEPGQGHGAKAVSWQAKRALLKAAPAAK